MAESNKTNSKHLRQKAEELLKKKSPETASQISEVEYIRLIHELQVHQIELELQNEELRHAWEVAEVANDKYVGLYDFAPSGYFSLSGSGAIKELNISGARMIGKPRNELKNKLFTFFVTEETKPIFRYFLEKVFKGKSKETCEIELVTHGNIPTCVLLTGVVTENQNECNVTAVDITENRMAQEALKSSEKRYRTTIESINDAFFSLDNELRFTYFNKKAEMLLLKRSSDVLGKKIFSEVFIADRGSVFEKKIQRALNATEICTFETFFGTEPDIDWYEVRVYPGMEGISVFFTTVTEKKKAESALRLSLLKYQTLFKLFPAGITISDSRGQIIETNSIAQRMLGLTPEDQKHRQIDGKEWRIIRPDGSPMPASEYASVRAFREKCQVENVEMGILKGDDQVTWVNVSATPIPLEGYDVAMVYTDITVRKDTEKKIRLLNETLEQHVAERTNQLVITNKELAFHLHELEQFAYVSNHDLQEPLRTINQFIRLFSEKYADAIDEDGKKYIEFISKSAVRMSKLVKDLLDYSVLGKESVKTMVDCNKIVACVLSDLYDSIKGRNAKITVHKLPVISGYETELRLLFQNLIENAIKYQRTDMVPEVTISAECQDMEWLFSIKDNGIGIDKKHYEKIFIIFQRLHNRNEFEGTGIGLAHCKKVVEMHGGKIWVESTPGAGSTFLFTIPKP